MVYQWSSDWHTVRHEAAAEFLRNQCMRYLTAERGLLLTQHDKHTELLLFFVCTSVLQRTARHGTHGMAHGIAIEEHAHEHAAARKTWPTVQHRKCKRTGIPAS